MHHFYAFFSLCLSLSVLRIHKFVDELATICCNLCNNDCQFACILLRTYAEVTPLFTRCGELIGRQSGMFATKLVGDGVAGCAFYGFSFVNLRILENLICRWLGISLVNNAMYLRVVFWFEPKYLYGLG